MMQSEDAVKKNGRKDEAQTTTADHTHTHL